MNEYELMFLKYQTLSENFEGTYEELIEIIKKELVPSKEKDKSAIIVLGYSGNGKTTWISRFVRKENEYEIISIDQVAKRIYEREKRRATWDEVIKDFGDRIEIAARNKKPIILDGNFLNLLTRSALTDTLRSLGYYITLIDLTPTIQDRLPKRLLDVVEKELQITITNENIKEIRDKSIFQRKAKEILTYHKMEKKRANFEEQERYGLLELGVDRVLNHDCSTEEAKYLPKFQK